MEVWRVGHDAADIFPMYMVCLFFLAALLLASLPLLFSLTPPVKPASIPPFLSLIISSRCWHRLLFHADRRFLDRPAAVLTDAR